MIDFFERKAIAWSVVVLLLLVQAGLVAYCATRLSPSNDEPGHLVAGLSHLRFCRFELYRVNPPLVRTVAALPIYFYGAKEDWSEFEDGPGARPTFKIGSRFVDDNGPDSIWLFVMARWACIPFVIAGGLFCYLISVELWGNRLSGVIAMCAWCFDPNVIAHGSIVGPDTAAASMGLLAAYGFLRWLKRPTGSSSFFAGLGMGVALLTKTTWIILFGLWPLIGCIWWLSKAKSDSVAENHRMALSAAQLVWMLCVGLFVLNAGYTFDGSFERLGEFKFVSESLGGNSEPSMNRFSGTWLEDLPVPLPKQYVLGIDVQKRDFESFGRASYLRGQWKDGGWWYYYLYGYLVKWPHGSQLLWLLGLLTVARLCWSKEFRRRLEISFHPGTVSFLLIPPLVVIVLVSMQLEFNHNFRYVLPATGFWFVLMGSTSIWFVTQGKPNQ